MPYAKKHTYQFAAEAVEGALVNALQQAARYHALGIDEEDAAKAATYDRDADMLRGALTLLTNSEYANEVATFAAQLVDLSLYGA